jgi:hypothetical protein
MSESAGAGSIMYHHVPSHVSGASPFRFKELLLCIELLFTDPIELASDDVNGRLIADFIEPASEDVNEPLLPLGNLISFPAEDFDGPVGNLIEFPTEDVNEPLLLIAFPAEDFSGPVGDLIEL